VGVETLVEERVAVVQHVLWSDGAADAGGVLRGLHEGHRLLGRGMFDHDLEVWDLGQHRLQLVRNEHLLPLEEVDLGVDHFAVDAQHDPVLLRNSDRRSQRSAPALRWRGAHASLQKRAGRQGKRAAR
jgi:hypothetical protein